MAEPRSKTDLKALHGEFLRKADEAFDKMFGKDGQNGLVTFTERETRACEASDELARWMMMEHVNRDESALALTAMCPLCGGPAATCDPPDPGATQTREIRTRRGSIEYERAARRCPRCRRIFFQGGNRCLRTSGIATTNGGWPSPRMAGSLNPRYLKHLLPP